MSARGRPALIGLFVVTGITLVVAGILALGRHQLSRHSVEFVSFFPNSVSGLKIGAPVKLQGIPIGEVTGIYLVLPSAQRAADSALIPVVYAVDPELIRQRGASTVRLGDKAQIKGLIDRGLRAELAVESFVTGTRYVSLEFRPDAPLHLTNDPGLEYPEIPIYQSQSIEEIQRKIGALIDNLGQADLVTLVASFNKLAKTANDLVAAPRTERLLSSVDSTLEAVKRTMQRMDRLTADVEPDMKPLLADSRETLGELRTTLKQAQTTLETLRSTVEPGSPTSERLNETMTEFARMARSLRALAEYLERNPSSVVRGRGAEPKEKKP